MEVICDVAWEQSDENGVLWPQQYYSEMLVRARLPAFTRPRTDQLQMWQTTNIPENFRTPWPLSQNIGHSKNRMASRRQREPCFGLAAISTKTHKHYRPEHNPPWIAHQVKCALQPSSLGIRLCISSVARETHLDLAGHIESTRSAMVCIGLTPWIDHGPKPDPKPDPKPKPTQPKPIPSV
jgi:hypothetical protein